MTAWSPQCGGLLDVAATDELVTGAVCEVEFGCAAGYLCPSGSDRPVPCPAGTYSSHSQPTSGPVTCVPCPVGRFGTEEAMSSPAACTPCPLGSNSSAGSTVCGVSSCPVVAVANDRVAWTVYNDVSGVEGINSCMFAIPKLRTPFLIAQSVCEQAFLTGNLLTAKQLTKPVANGSDLLSMAASLPVVAGSDFTWIGAVSDRNTGVPPISWRWVDASVAVNLNCIPYPGCGIWDVDQPL